MSDLIRLNISGIRNIAELEISPCSTINLVYGENGSGKTSILEAIFLLAYGRSFRSSKLNTLISRGLNEATVYVELSSSLKIGFHRTRHNSHQLKLAGETQRNWDKVARELPVQILDAHSFTLLEGGPKARRRFLDWGVFHVEPAFVSNWRKTRKCIANRNFLLKQQNPDWDQLAAWDVELCASAEAVHQAREHYFQQFIPVFEEVYGVLSDRADDELSLVYQRGWSEERELAHVLVDNRKTDAKYGATQNGPHWADIIVKQGSRPAVEVLSRGQQKILVSALKISQGILLSRAVDRHCIYLVDDLPAELDPSNRAKILGSLRGLGGQVFITGVELEALTNSLEIGPEVTMFHVERGRITS